MSSSHVRTSDSHPIYANFVDLPTNVSGKMGKFYLLSLLSPCLNTLRFNVGTLCGIKANNFKVLSRQSTSIFHDRCYLAKVRISLKSDKQGHLVQGCEKRPNYIEE